MPHSSRLDYARAAEKMKRGEGRDARVPEQALLARLMPNGPPLTMYDIGVGAFSEYETYKTLFPDMTLYGCEPHLEEYQGLLPHFKGQLWNIAISNITGSRPIFKSKLGQGGSSFYGHGISVTQEVETWTLDQFDKACGCPEKILLWMDIEDSELDALQSGINLLKSGRIEWINLESRNVPSMPGRVCTQDLVDFLKPFGYYKVIRYNVQGAYPEAPGDVIFFKEGVKPLIDCPLEDHPWRQDGTTV